MPIPQSTKALFADSAKRSTMAHLFHFYPLLCELASIPHRSPSYAVRSGSRSSVHTVSDGTSVKGEENGQEPSVEGSTAVVVEWDARRLAMECLREIGREMGLSA
jgi:hypothetical protein